MTERHARLRPPSAPVPPLVSLPLTVLLTAALLLATFAGLAAADDRQEENPQEPRTVLLEIFTNTSCGHCPDGDLERERLQEEWGARLIVAEHHQFDAMESPVAHPVGTAMNLFARPTAAVDRTDTRVLMRTLWAEELEARMAEPALAQVYVDTRWNETTRALDIAMAVLFDSSTTGALTTGCLVLEDPVVGEGPGYDQANFSDGDPDHPYGDAGDPIVGFEHRYIVREAPGGAFGTTDSIPATVAAGDLYEERFDVTLPGEDGPDHWSVACYVAWGEDGGPSGQTSREIEASAWTPIGGSSPTTLLSFDAFESGGTDHWDHTLGGAPPGEPGGGEEG